MIKINSGPYLSTDDCSHFNYSFSFQDGWRWTWWRKLWLLQQDGYMWRNPRQLWSISSYQRKRFMWKLQFDLCNKMYLLSQDICGRALSVLYFSYISYILLFFWTPPIFSYNMANSPIFPIFLFLDLLFFPIFLIQIGPWTILHAVCSDYTLLKPASLLHFYAPWCKHRGALCFRIDPVWVGTCVRGC